MRININTFWVLVILAISAFSSDIVTTRHAIGTGIVPLLLLNGLIWWAPERRELAGIDISPIRDKRIRELCGIVALVLSAAIVVGPVLVVLF